jgi:formate/nitrite transporter FocA (FNT family)
MSEETEQRKSAESINSKSNNSESNDTESNDTESKKMAREVEDLSQPKSRIVYEAIKQAGQEELTRPTQSLLWSGIAAGILISFSVLGEAILRTYLPDAPYGYLIENIGYSLGFMLVILGRMQLFTENTITTVLPLIEDFKKKNMFCVAKLWSIVLAANVIGAFLITALYVFTPALPEDVAPAMLSLSEHAVFMPPLDSFYKAIPAGILIAAIVWMIPQSESSAFMIILVFTWLIAAGDFTHIVAGSVEMAYLMWLGELGLMEATFGFFIPVFLGNVVGGTLIFSFLVWGQVKNEIE